MGMHKIRCYTMVTLFYDCEQTFDTP